MSRKARCGARSGFDLVSCDAGIHPGWKGKESPHTGYIFAIEIV